MILLKIYYGIIKPFLYKSIGRYHLSQIGAKGVNVVIHGPVTIHDYKNLSLGSHTRVGKNAFFMCNGGVEIGKNVQMSRNVIIYSTGHDYNGLAVPYDNNHKLAKVVIGDNVWIGMDVKILPGVHIGEGSIIGMGTTVTKSVPPGSIVVGSGQRIVGSRDMNRYKELVKQNKLFGQMWPEL